MDLKNNRDWTILVTSKPFICNKIYVILYFIEKEISQVFYFWAKQ